MSFRHGLLPRFRPCLPRNHLRIRSVPPLLSRRFHASSLLWGIKSQVLKDVGEGELPDLLVSSIPLLTMARYHRGSDHSMVCGGRGSHRGMEAIVSISVR